MKQLTLTKWRKINKTPTNKLLKRKVSEYIINKDWYLNSYNAIREMYPQDHKLFSSLLACTSQQTTVKTNVDNTLRAYNDIMNGRDPTVNDFGIASPPIKNNIKRVLRGEEPHGNKIKPFCLALRGDLSQIVIDTWMLKVFNIKRKSPNKTDIKYISNIIIKLSEDLDLKPCEIQSCLWVYVKTEMNDTTAKETHDFSYYLKKHNAIMT